MNPEKSLWGDLPLQEVTRTPVITLREQATILTKLTDGLLEGIVLMRTSPRIDRLFSVGDNNFEFNATLSIRAPALDGYVLLILEVGYNLSLYPVTVTDSLGAGVFGRTICEDESALMAAIGKILSSDSVRHAIRLLLAQSRSTESDIAA